MKSRKLEIVSDIIFSRMFLVFAREIFPFRTTSMLVCNVGKNVSASAKSRAFVTSRSSRKELSLNGWDFMFVI